MSMKLKVKLHALVGMNTQSSIEVICTLFWLAHAFGTRLYSLHVVLFSDFNYDGATLTHWRLVPSLFGPDRAGFYGKCVLYQNQIVFNRLNDVIIISVALSYM